MQAQDDILDESDAGSDSVDVEVLPGTYSIALKSQGDNGGGDGDQLEELISESEIDEVLFEQGDELHVEHIDEANEELVDESDDGDQHGDFDKTANGDIQSDEYDDSEVEVLEDVSRIGPGMAYNREELAIELDSEEDIDNLESDEAGSNTYDDTGNELEGGEELGDLGEGSGSPISQNVNEINGEESLRVFLATGDRPGSSTLITDELPREEDEGDEGICETNIDEGFGWISAEHGSEGCSEERVPRYLVSQIMIPIILEIEETQYLLCVNGKRPTDEPMGLETYDVSLGTLGSVAEFLELLMPCNETGPMRKKHETRVFEIPDLGLSIHQLDEDASSMSVNEILWLYQKLMSNTPLSEKRHMFIRAFLGSDPCEQLELVKKIARGGGSINTLAATMRKRGLSLLAEALVPKKRRTGSDP